MDSVVFKNHDHTLDLYLLEDDKTTSIYGCEDIEVKIDNKANKLVITLPVNSIQIVNNS